MNLFKKFQINLETVFVLIFACLFAFAVLQVPANILANYWINKQAPIKAQDPSNLKQGCLYYVGDKVVGGRTATTVRQYVIDNLYFSDLDKRSLSNAPFQSDEKIRQFRTDIEKYGTSKCYQISYLHFDYIIVERFYFYDYFGVK